MRLADNAPPARPADTKRVPAIDCRPALRLPYREDSIQSKREVPERSDIFYRIRLVNQNCLCLFSEPPSLLGNLLELAVFRSVGILFRSSSPELRRL